jgi:hypothetical protein
MKRVALTSQIEATVRKALGADADLANLAIYEAIALNTLPLRKRHPLYNGAKADVSFLYEMAAELSRESRPVHVGHNNEGIPLGRVFHGSVVANGAESELRVLFFLDASEAEAIQKVENGTVDQVSVSVLPKQVLNSASGFDYLGPDATFDNIYSGDDGEGNILNQNGVYARMVGLDSFFEMSLVGQGGAQNARIVRRDQSHFGSSFEKLAASGLDPNSFVLVASIEADAMDLSALVAQLTDTKVELASTKTDVTAKDAMIATLTADKSALETQLAELGDVPAALAAKDGEIATLAADKTAVEAARDAAVVSLQAVAKAILTAAGKVDAEIPSDVAELSALIESTETGLAAALVVGGRAAGADASSVETPSHGADLSAFVTRK